MLKWLMILPPIMFAGLAALFLLGMQRDNPQDIPSVFIGKAAPSLPDTQLGDLPLLTAADLASGQVTVVNFWASWCPPCRAEHPVLKEMAAKGIRVAGINMMDDPEKALKYLEDDGNPFFAIAADPKGRNRLEWGVTAPPETFIIGKTGTVLFKFIGPLVGTDYENRFKPALEAALAAP